MNRYVTKAVEAVVAADAADQDRDEARARNYEHLAVSRAAVLLDADELTVAEIATLSAVLQAVAVRRLGRIEAMFDERVPGDLDALTGALGGS